MPKSITIIGAGVAGLMCAQRLVESGLSVSIFDKSRGVGGRLASRRIENGVFNHGASEMADFRTNTDLPQFAKKILEKAVSENILISNGSTLTAYASMKTFTDHISRGIKIEKEAEIVSIKNQSPGIELLLKDTSAIQLNENILIFAIPQPQVLNLLQNKFSAISDLIKPAKMYASISGLFAFDQSISRNSPNSENENIIAHHENSRIGQDLLLDCWTVHSKKTYGQHWIDLDKDEIKDLLLNNLKELDLENFTKPVYSAGHRWLYGFTEKSLNLDYIYNDHHNIGICGDWCRGDTVIDAVISGVSLAEKILPFILNNKILNNKKF